MDFYETTGEKMISLNRKTTRLVFLIMLLILNCAFPFLWEKATAVFSLSDAVSGMVTAIHESLCSLSAAYLIYVFSKEQHCKPWFKYLGLSLLAVAIGDLNYGLTSYIFPTPPPRGYRPLVHEIPYVIFMGSLALAAVLRALEKSSKKSRTWMSLAIFSIGAAYFICSYRLILFPFFHDSVSRPFAIYTTATLYAVGQSVAVGALIVASLRTIGWSEFLLWFMFLTLNASDFVLRYQDIGKTQLGVPLSEYGWEFALAFVCSLFFLIREKKESFPAYVKPPAPVFSLRVVMAATSLCVLLAFVVITWSLSRYLGVVNAGNVGGYVLAFVVIWSCANGFSILLSKSLRDIHSRLLMHADHVEENQTALAWEVDQIFTFLNQRNRELTRERDTVLRITSTVAHNLRTPLQGLRVALPRLERNMGESCGCRETNWTAIESLKESTRVMETTASDLLLERKKMVHAETIQSAVEGAVNIAGLSFPKKSFEMRNNIAPTAFRVPGLTPVLLNLLSNAAEASSDDQPVCLRLERHSGHYKIEIQDQGEGIAPPLLEALERGQEITTKPNGNGLGVSSAVQWAQQNGYGLTFSTGKEQGTTITLNIPG
jgi:signal transduction histidine kinase